MGNIFCSKNADSEVSQSLTSNPSTSSASEGQRWRVGLGAGCYWGTEKFISHIFPARSGLPMGAILPGGQVGFMGPKNSPSNPSYKDVCTGKTGHVEVYDFEFTGGAPYFEAIIRFFFMFHDPTTANRQGGDTGTQYASVVYCYNDEEVEIVNKVKADVQALLNAKLLKGAYSSVRVTTDVRKVSDSSPFFAAHAEHQDYLTANPNGYCNHGFKFKEWPALPSEKEEDSPSSASAP